MWTKSWRPRSSRQPEEIRSPKTEARRKSEIRSPSRTPNIDSLELVISRRRWRFRPSDLFHHSFALFSGVILLADPLVGGAQSLIESGIWLPVKHAANE